MFFSIFGVFMFIMKFSRFIFILISLEFMVMGLFFDLILEVSPYMFFFFLGVSVVSSVLGMVFMVFITKSSGSEKILF